jgi:acetyl esterase/lipase
MSYQYDPEFTDLIASIPATDMSDPVAARENMQHIIAKLNADVSTDGLTISDMTINTNGARDIPARLYQPQSGHRGGALLFIHGGGFVVGNLETEHASVISIARNLGITVLSVDYRLAPEHPFPEGLEDCYDSLCWLVQQSDAYGFSKDKVGVFGQSAGGGLAAATALLCKQRGGPHLCFQFLGMPELDDRLLTYSMQQFTDTPLWNRPNAELSWAYYLGDSFKPGAEDVPILAAPARASAVELEGLPPAYITAMEFDPLRDEDLRYAMQLLEAGVPCEVHCFPGTFHGSSLFAHAAISQRMQKELLTVLERGLNLD